MHPELVHAARRLPRGVLRPWSLRLLRALIGLMVWCAKPLAGVHVSVHPLPGTTATVRLLRPAHPAGRPLPVLLWIHGGGYVLGQAAQDDHHLCGLMAATDLAVVSVNYRLAPEHPWPAALDDCSAAQAWLHREGPALGLDSARLIIGGQSAGGGLAAALALRTADAGGQAPLLQLLSYPMLDDRTTLRRQRLDVRLWDEASNLWGWRAYLGREPGGVGITELMAPARRHTMAGLPPAWIGVGTEDLFHDEDVLYALRLQAAGVPCTLEVVPGAFHGFDGAAPDAPVSQRYFDAQCAALRQVLVPAVEPALSSAVPPAPASCSSPCAG